MSVYEPHLCGVGGVLLETRRGRWIPVNWSYSKVVVSNKMWVLETELCFLKDQWLLFSFLFILQELPS